MYVDVILFVMCKENPTICNVYINLTQTMFGSYFTSCLLEGACLIYVISVCLRAWCPTRPVYMGNTVGVLQEAGTVYHLRAHGFTPGRFLRWSPCFSSCYFSVRCCVGFVLFVFVLWFLWLMLQGPLCCPFLINCPFGFL